MQHFLIALFFGWFSAIAQTAWNPPPTLESSWKQLTDSLAPGSRLGLAVRSVQSGKLVHKIAEQELFTPASTLKILVTAAALDEIPLDYHPTTELRLEGKQQGSTFLGSLKVVGKGDPNISARYFPHALVIPLQMVDSLRSLGIDTIKGQLLADSSWFSGSRRPAAWRTQHFDAWYGAEVSALSFNDNCFRLEVSPGESINQTALLSVQPDVDFVQVENLVQTVAGRRRNIQYEFHPQKTHLRMRGEIGLQASPFSIVLPVRDPASYFLAALRTAMKERGLVFVQDNDQESGPLQANFTFTTAPLLSILDEVNQRSQNMHAEMLLRNLGALRYGEGSETRGLQAGRAFLQRIGIDPQDIHAVDGSGLGSESRVKPAAMSQLLAVMARHPRGPIFMQSLGHPGITGASATRLANLPVAHRVRLKTGFINNVQGLVGYIATSYGDTLAVALHLTQYRVNDNLARDILDTLWTRLSLAHNAEFESLREARRLWNLPKVPGNYLEKLEYFSRMLLGRPYLLGPTGEGVLGTVEQGPLMNMHQFDCVTYLEHVMALAGAPHPDSIFSLLQNIRYEEGRIDFISRKHYFVEDWIGKNPRWVRELPFPGDSAVVRTMNKGGFFAARKIRHTQTPRPITIRFLPFERALQWAREDNDGPIIRGVAFLARNDDLCVTHTGFLVRRRGLPPLLRHASTTAKKVVDQELGEYLESRRGRTPGIFVFEFLDPQISITN